MNLDLGTLSSASTGRGTSSGPATLPAITLRAMSVQGITIPEGTAQEWTFLFAGDIMYCVPILLAWVLSMAPKSLRQPTGK